MKNMKLDYKKLGIVIAIVVVIIIIIAIAVSGGNKDEQNISNNNDISVIEGEKLSEVKEYKGLEVSNVKFTIGENMTRLTADVANNTSEDREGQYVNINILDENGTRITSTMGWINSVEAGGTTEIGASFISTGNERKAYDIEITEKRESKTDNENNIDNTNNEND